ncbi:cell division ATP-binding protein FtsE [Thermanaerovibrio acidaminovorans]|jgi:cell division transport system ATP-binding protein|uniref:ABC transporter related protein n=1 Tax=Thermanaerovibrio acidaminovorans (strain ATCC 49978 / DSM 6589 / Su883) TaxID=525903 RepID=D1B8X0_THEAS|nr:ATP-binding cassette domain-containing protein [Thermanaerovibrio acidaminovorans]ACZ18723.1 ABC transporter related protein [Thermanaerovibrio acidaminovorans DSM 6589]
MDIRLSGVTKIFHPDITALEDIYLDIPKGEFVYLVGPTGSGKTTLMRTITREVLPTRGQVMVGSYSLRKIGRVDLSLFRREVGVVYQDFCLLPHLNVFENVAFVLEVLGMPPREVKERADEVLERVNLWRRRFLYPPQLSGGEQQRVAIARAIVNSPSILLADEPTGNLDLHTAEEIMQLLLSINAMGTTILMATHNQYLVDSYRQRVVELKMGRIVRDEKRGRYEIDGEL